MNNLYILCNKFQSNLFIINKGWNEKNISNVLFWKRCDIFFQIRRELLHIRPILKHSQMVQYLINKRFVLDGE